MCWVIDVRTFPAPVTLPLTAGACHFVSCLFFLTRQPAYGSLLGWSQESAGKRPRQGIGEGKGKGEGSRKGGKSGEMEKRYYFDGTNSAIYWKHRTSLFTRLKTNWFLSANEPKSNPKSGQKLTPCAASKSKFASRKALAGG
jgi:hypothetical protein